MSINFIENIDSSKYWWINVLYLQENKKIFVESQTNLFNNFANTSIHTKKSPIQGINWVWQVPHSFKTKCECDRYHIPLKQNDWILREYREQELHTQKVQRLEKRSYGAYIKLEIVYIIGNVKWICKISHASQFSVVNGHSNSLESRIHLKQHFLFYPSRILA